MTIIDLRSITSKRCGVRTVALELFKRINLSGEIIVILNKSYPIPVPKEIRVIEVSKFYSRFNPIGDVILSLKINKQIKGANLIAFHSWLPMFFYKPNKSSFILHDTFSLNDKEFFQGKGFVRAIISRLFFKVLTWVSVYRATMVLCPSEFTKKNAERLFPNFSKKFLVHRNGFIPEKTKHPETTSKLKFFLYVGNFRSYKGFKQLAKAWSNIQNTFDFSLFVVGNDKKEKYEEIKSSYKLKNVIFWGQLSDEKLNILFQQSSGVIIPSIEEGFGIPIIDAVSKGLRVIASNCDAHLEFGFKSPTYFNRHDHNVLSSLLLSFDPAIDHKVLQNDLEITKTYDWDIVARNFWQTINLEFNED